MAQHFLTSPLRNLYTMFSLGSALDFHVEENFQVSDITVILCVRIMETNQWLLPRLESLSYWYSPVPQFLVVDYGSKSEYQEKIKALCDRAGYQYHYVDNQDVFSLSEARNTGFLNSKTDLLFFTDPDFVMQPDIFLRMVDIANSKTINRDKLLRLTMPAYHVSKFESSYFEACNGQVEQKKLLNEWAFKGVYSANNSVFEFVAPYSNNFLCHKLLYDLSGGYSLDFRGHGSEDFEFMIRLNILFGNMPMPSSIEDDQYQPFSDEYYHWKNYSGFRRLAEVESMSGELFGLRAFHIWHPRIGADGWFANADNKRAKFNNVLSRYLGNELALLEEDYLPRSKKALCVGFDSSDAGYFIPLRLDDYALTVLSDLDPFVFNKKTSEIESGQYNLLVLSPSALTHFEHLKSLLHVAKLCAVEIIYLKSGLFKGTVIYEKAWVNRLVGTDVEVGFESKNKQLVRLYDNYLSEKELLWHSLKHLLGPIKRDARKKVGVFFEEITEFLINKQKSVISFPDYINNILSSVTKYDDILFLFRKNDLPLQAEKALENSHNVVIFDDIDKYIFASVADVLLAYVSCSSDIECDILGKKSFSFNVVSSSSQSIKIDSFLELLPHLSNNDTSSYDKEKSLISLSNYLKYQCSYFSISDNIWKYDTERKEPYKRVKVSTYNGYRQHLIGSLDKKYQYAESSYVASKMALKGRFLPEKDDLKLLTLIIPILSLAGSSICIEKKLTNIISLVPLRQVNVLIVIAHRDDEFEEILSELANHKAVTVIYAVADQDSNILSLYNFGAQYALTPVIIFSDLYIDFSELMYKRLLKEVQAKEIDGNRGREFFVVPKVKLTKQGLVQRAESDSEVFDSLLQHEFLVNNNKLIASIEYCSSCLVVNKYHFLQIGGYRSDLGSFCQYDAIYRLLFIAQEKQMLCKFYNIPFANQHFSSDNFEKSFVTITSNLTFKGLYGLVKEENGHDGIGISMSMLKYQQKLFRQYQQDFNKHSLNYKNIKDLSENRKTLILTEKNSRIVELLRDAFSLMGELECRPESDFGNADCLVEYINNNGITHVGFRNPTEGIHRKALYDNIKSKGFSFWTFDKGLLPNSWFFDSYGYKNESELYHPKMWNSQLTDENATRVKQYIQTLHFDENRMGVEYLRSKLNVGNRQVLFFLFYDEVEEDVYFHQHSLEVIEQLDKKQWLIIAKNVSSMASFNFIDGVEYVDKSYHLYDLFEVADVVAHRNSDFSLLCSTLLTPTIAYEELYFSHKGLGYRAVTPKGFLELLQSKLSVNEDVMHRFVSYLTTKAYSFEVPHHYPHIVFESIRGLSNKTLILGAAKPFVQLDNLYKCSCDVRHLFVKKGYFLSCKAKRGVTKMKKIIGSVKPRLKLW